MLIPPPVLAVLAAVVQRALSRTSPPPTRARIASATVVAAGSAALLGGSLRQFRRRSTTVDPLHPDRATALVTTGPNRVTRNPMYVGAAGLLASHGILRGAWVTVLPMAAFVVAIDRLQIRAEEEALQARFGADYAAYRAQVPRWLGRPSGRGPR